MEKLCVIPEAMVPILSAARATVVLIGTAVLLVLAIHHSLHR